MKQPGNCAIFGVDAQVCFGHPNGGLYVPGGEEVVAPGNLLIQYGLRNGYLIVLSCDWHPPDSDHFKPVGQWPPHGIAGTRDAEFLDGLIVPKNAFIVRKGKKKEEDGYDPFDGQTDNGQAPEQILAANKVEAIFVWGIALEYCDKAAVLTACKLAKKHGWNVYLVVDACRAVNPDDAQKAINEMRTAGAIITTVEEVIHGKA
ncbi:MAG: isochorismatase family protein [bacterium]|nr:isochorismatase family protein [bacterium]